MNEITKLRLFTIAIVVFLFSSTYIIRDKQPLSDAKVNYIMKY